MFVFVVVVVAAAVVVQKFADKKRELGAKFDDFYYFIQTDISLFVRARARGMKYFGFNCLTHRDV